jgi:hypothetical protein
MPRKRPGFTFERHQQVGEELKEIDRKLGSLLVSVCEAYGPSSKQSKAAEKAAKGVSRLRSELDNAVCGEHPEKTDKEVISCYYPLGERG